MLKVIAVGMRRQIGVLAVAGIVIALLCAGCGSSTVTRTGSGAKASFYTGGTPGGTPVRGGKAVIDMTEAPSSLDPVALASTISADVSLQISEGLVETVPGSTEVHPDLATSWTISPSGLTYTFHIREGVKFSNGEPLTGEDVVYSIERQKLPIASFSVFFLPVVKKVSLIGPMTVQIQLKHVEAPFLSDFGFAQLAIVPKKVVEHESEKVFALHPVGTGPFMLTSAAPGFTNMVMTRNPHYWHSGQPYLNELTWNQVIESNARILAVQSGSATIDLSVPFSQAGSLQKSANGNRLLIEPILSESLAEFNSLKAPFTNLNVRKALNYATPREAIIKNVFKGLGTPANNVTNDLFKYYDPSVPSFSYDIAKAKDLMKGSPVPNGFNMSLMIYSGDPTSALIASILQSSWAQIGVHVSIRALPPTTFGAEETKHSYDMFLWTPEFLVSEQYEPDLTAAEFAGGKVPTFKINSPRGAKLIEEASATLDNARRAKLFPELQRLVYWEEAQYLPIAFVPQINLVSGSLRGYTYPPNSYFHMREAWLAR